MKTDLDYLKEENEKIMDQIKKNNESRNQEVTKRKKAEYTTGEL